jgi:flagellar hook-associated protein FlgK
MVQARNSFDANTKVIKTVDEMDKTLIKAVG